MYGKFCPSEQQFADMLKQHNESQSAEDREMRPDNIQAKRDEMHHMIEGLLEQRKELIGGATSKCDNTPLSVTSKDGAVIKVYMIRPKALTDKKAPAFIFARGGGACVSEAEEMNEILCISALNMNCVVFNVGFRNGPECKCPGGQEDMRAAILDAHKNADQYGIDKTRIVIGGVSGGGWICLGAANLMVKSGEISKVRAMFLDTPMITNELGKIPKEK